MTLHLKLSEQFAKAAGETTSCGSAATKQPSKASETTRARLAAARQSAE